MMNVNVIKDKSIKLLSETLIDNPVVTKEFRTRMRGWKPFSSIAIYVVFLSIAMLIAYYTNWMESQTTPDSMVNSTLGSLLFSTVFITQTVLLAIILPSLSSNAITFELEKKTIEMLALSNLTSAKIVIGKQVSSFLFAIILMACSLPLASLSLMFGGISPQEIIVSYLILAAWCYMFSAIGVFCSSINKKTSGAAIMASGISIMYMLNTISLGAMGVSGGMYGSSSSSLQPFTLLNPAFAPFVALSSANLYGINIPIALTTIILEISVGILLLLWTTNNVKHKKANRSLSIRLLLIGVSIFVIALFCGDIRLASFMGATKSSLKYHLSTFSITAMVLSMFATAFFATGSIKKNTSESIMQYASKIRNTFKNDLSGGIGFMMLLALSSYLFYGIIGIIRYSFSTTFSLSYFLPMYLESGIAIMAIVFCVSSFGIFFSTLTKQRAVAGGMLVFVIIALFAIYPLMTINSVPGDKNLVATLWPAAPILTATNNWTSNMLQFGFPKAYVWMAGTVIYSLMGLGALSLANFTHKKYGGVVEDE